MIPKAFRFSLFKQAYRDWKADKAERLGAALAYYTIFSLSPLLLIVIGICGAVFGEDAAQNHIFVQLQGLLGKEGAEAVQSMLANSRHKDVGIVATTVGVIVMFVGATGLFAQLQSAIDTVWQVESPVENGIWTLLKTRWISFAMILGIGFLLLVSLLVSTLIAALGDILAMHLPQADLLLSVINLGTSLAVITVLFAMIFKFLPNIEVAWNDVWNGAFVTALLFTIGKFFIGLYLGNSAVGSAYGGAGAVIIVLLWTYYSAQILLFGAEYTQVFARTHGSHSGEKD